MGMYQYIKKTWQNQDKETRRDRLVEWRKEGSTVRIERPTRLDRARSLGYKAKQGVIMVRQRVPRGGRMRGRDFAGRRPKRSSQRVDLKKSYRQVAEERASRAYTNCEVLNSYEAGKDGHHYWYEIILIDRTHPSILADSRFAWISQKKGRAERGLTSAGRKSRGLMNKGKGAEKMRPSLRAHNRKAT